MVTGTRIVRSGDRKVAASHLYVGALQLSKASSGFVPISTVGCVTGLEESALRAMLFAWMAAVGGGGRHAEGVAGNAGSIICFVSLPRAGGLDIGLGVVSGMSANCDS